MADEWHELRDWTGGEMVVESHMDEQIRDNLTWIYNRLLAYGVAEHTHADRVKAA